MAELTTVFAPKGNRARDASNASRALVSFFFFIITFIAFVHFFFACLLFCALISFCSLICIYLFSSSSFIPRFGSFFMLLYTFPVLICFFVHLYAFVFLLANKLKYCRASKIVIKYYSASKCTVEPQKATLKHGKLRKSVKISNQEK